MHTVRETTPLPAPPQRQQGRDDFNDTADAFSAALVTYQAEQNGQADDITALAADIAAAIAGAQALWEANGTSVQSMSDWYTGTVNGGPNGDGLYPFTGTNAAVVMLPCLAKVIASIKAAGGTGTGSSFDPQTLALLNAADTPDLADGAPTMLGVNADGAVKRFSVDLFASRRTADLADAQLIIGTELIPSYLNDTGLSKRISAAQLGKYYLGGAINAKMAPYNCKGDTQEVRDVQTTAGSTTIYSPSGLFRASDVGKLCFLSAAGGSYQRLHTTITAFIDAQHVTIATAASVNFGGATQTTWYQPKSGMYCMWGTDDTAGLLQALYDAQSRGVFSYGGVVILPPGMYLTGALPYYARTALIGYGPRVSVLARKHATSPGAGPTRWSGYQSPTLYNYSVRDDFPQIQNIGVYGARYYQYAGCSNLVWQGAQATSDYPPQTEAGVFFAHIHSWQASHHGLETYFNHSGTQIAVETFECQNNGWLNCAYDVNAMNFLAISCGNAGYQSGDGYNAAANCNLVNAKISYNGFGGNSDITGANFVERGFGNNYTNMRLQESWGSQLVLAGSTWCKFGDVGIDDTGCINPAHGGGSSSLLPFRAALALLGNTTVGNLFNDVSFGRAVHPNNDYLTHAVFTTGDSSSNRGRLFSRPGTTYYGSGVSPYAPGVWGTTSSGGFGVTNTLTVDGAGHS